MRRLGVVSSGNKLGQSITLLSDRRDAAEHETRRGTARPERYEPPVIDGKAYSRWLGLPSLSSAMAAKFTA